MNTKLQKGHEINTLIELVTYRTTTTQSIAKRIDCSMLLLEEVINGNSENISDSTLNKMLNNLRNY